jgi:SSS family solute:Na+ symporter
VGVFWKRATAPAALWSFIVGVTGGFARLATDLLFKDVTVSNGSNLKELKVQLYQGTITADQYANYIAPIKQKYGLLFTMEDIHWLYWCQILFATTLVLMIVISLLTKAPDPKTVKFTWYGATPEEKIATRASWNWIDVVLSVVIVAIVICFYIKFF